MKATKTGI